MVESSKQNKSLFLGVAAATALVGATLLYYHYVFSNPDDEGGSSYSIVEELREANLDKVKKDPSGHMYDPQYVVELLNFVTNTGRKRREGERKAALDNRREAFKSENWEEYREIVQTQFQKEDQMCQTIMKEILDVFTETFQHQFQMTMQTMAQNPQYAQMIMAAQQGKNPWYAQMIMAAQQGKLPSGEKMAQAKAQPKLPKQKTLQAFQESKKLTMDAMKRQMTMQQKAQMGGQDEMQMMIDMFVDEAKVEDALFIKTGVTNDELEDSIMYLMGMDDPEMKKEMTSYMTEMQKAMGPGGAGPGPGGF